MKIRTVINPFKALMLDESRLTSEFKIGFELEAICKNPEWTSISYSDLPSYHSGRQPTGHVKELFDKLNEMLGMGEGHIEGDSSVDPQGRVTTASGHEYSDRADSGDSWGFEYVSPIIQFTPKNISKIYTFLKSLKDIGIVTNNHCGFHTHISYPDIDKENVGWLLFCIANDDNLREEVKALNMGEYKIDFFGRYADEQNITKLKRLGDNLKNNDNYNEDLSSSDKYRTFRIHPQGTIEWRGPRNFINDGSAPKEIETYLRELHKVIMSMGQFLDKKEFNGFKREDVAKHLQIYGSFDTEVEKKKEEKGRNLVKSFVNNPKKIFSLSPASMKKLLTQNVLEELSRNGSFLNALRDSGQNGMAFSTQQAKAFISLLFENLSMSRVDDILRAWTDSYDAIAAELSEDILSNLLYRRSHADAANITKSIGSKMIIKDPNLLKRCAEKYIENRDDNGFLKILIKNDKYLDLNTFMAFAKKDPSLLRRFNNVPRKVQMAITKRNPYAIQYINDPDPSVIDALKKKHGEEIEDYILEKV